MPSVLVRPASAGDLEAIDRLIVRARRPSYDREAVKDAALGLDERARIEYRRIVDGRLDWAILAVADEGERAVGFAHAEAGGDGSIGELDSIYVDPDRWHRGVGQLLMRYVVDWFRDRGCLAAALWVRESNSRAQGFYAASGWAPDGTERVSSVDGGIAVREVGYRLPLG